MTPAQLRAEADFIEAASQGAIRDPVLGVATPGIGGPWVEFVAVAREDADVMPIVRSWAVRCRAAGETGVLSLILRPAGWEVAVTLTMEATRRLCDLPIAETPEDDVEERRRHA